MATIVDALIVTLGLDSKNFKSGNKEAQRDFNETKRAASDANAQLKDVGRTLAGLFAVFTAGRGLKNFTEEITNQNAQLERLSRNIRVNTTDLSAWGQVAARNGGTAEALQNTLSGLSQQMTEIATTGTAGILPYMRALGVQLSDNTGRARPLTDILLQLSDVFAGADRPTANNLLKSMGIDQGTANAILEGRVELEKMLERQREITALTPKQAYESRKLSEAMVDFQFALLSIGRAILVMVTPALTAFFNGLQKVALWLRDHPALLIGLANIIGVVLTAALWNAARAAWAFLAPILLMAAPFIAAAAALALLADDWYTWLRGGKSALGDLWDTFAEVIRKIENAGPMVINAIRKAFAGAREAAMNVIFGVERGVGAAAGAVGGVVNLPPGSRADLMSRIVSGAANGAVAGAAGPASWQAMDFFTNNGWTRDQAAGIIANLKAESNFNPGAVGDGGKAYGIAQWHPDRQAAFKAWSGKDISEASLLDQLRFVQFELTEGNEKDAGGRLRGATNARDAGAIVSQYYERPAGGADEATSRGSAAVMIAQGIPGAERASLIPQRSGSAAQSTNTTDVSINQVIVHTQATDARGIAADIGSALKSRMLANQADTGID